MYCIKCGNQIEENNKFCCKCGNPINNLESHNINNTQTVPSTNPLVENNNQAVNVGNKKTIFNMNKININILLIGLIVLIILIVGIHMGYNLMNKNKTRTIMIYMVGADLESNGGLASRDLYDLDYNEVNSHNTKVILMAGGSKSWHNSYIDSNKTAIYELEPTGFVKVDNKDLTNMGTSENLTYFLNYGYEHYKTSKYNLIFWNHGGAVDGSEYDELNQNDNLSIPEIKKAFANSPFNEKNKLDVISFRTCLNATLEIANTLKDYSNYLVASEEVTIGSILDSALSFINEVTPADNQETYGKKQIENYKKSVTTACNAQQETNLEENLCVNFTYSIIDLSKIDNINKKLESFSNDINKKLSSNYNDIVKIRTSLKQYPLEDGDDYDMVDLMDLTNHLQDYSSNSKELINSIKDAVLYNVTNNKYSNGLSIYFPYNKGIFLTNYQSFAPSKNYSDLLFNFYQMKNKVKSNSFNNFSSMKGVSKKTKSGGSDFEIELTDEQVSNFAKASCYIFVDMKDGYHKLVYGSKSPYLEGNKLKVNVRGKMLRISDKEYTDTSEWLQQIEQETNDEYTESSVVFILTKGNKKRDVVKANIRVDEKHPNGFIKSVLSTSEDKNKQAMFFSKNAVNLKDYAFIQVVEQSYQILDENGKFRSDFLKHGNGIFTGHYYATNMIKLIPEDFNSKYDYYGVFAIKDVADNVYYSDIVKMN